PAVARWAGCSVPPAGSTRSSAKRSRRAASGRCASATGSRTTSTCARSTCARRWISRRVRVRRTRSRWGTPSVARSQSAGCEHADELAGRPLLMFHGDRDELLPVQASEMVRFIAETGELVVLPGEGHLFSHARDVLLARTVAFVEDVLPAP